MIDINKANDAEGFSAFAEVKTPDVFTDMKNPDMFSSSRPELEESNSAFTAFSDMMGPAGMDLFKSTNNNPDTLLGLVAEEVGVTFSIFHINLFKEVLFESLHNLLYLTPNEEVTIKQ